MNIKVKKRLLLAIIISAGFMVFLLSRVDWKHFSLIVGRLNIKELIAAYCVFLLGNLVRTFRFFKLDHLGKKLTHWWHISIFYNFITATVPGGSGEAVTAYVLKRFSKFNILGAFRILLFSRLMDLFGLSLLFFISAIWISSITPYREASIWLSGTLFLISIVALLPSSERFILKLMQQLPMQNNLIQRVCEKMSGLSEIAEQQSSYHSLGIPLFQSVLTTIGGVATLHLILRASGIDFTPVQSVYCYGVYMVFQIVPIQGIAGIGTQAAWWALALNAAGYQANDAIVLGFILHGTFYLFIASMGILSVIVWLKGKKRNNSSC